MTLKLFFGLEQWFVLATYCRMIKSTLYLLLNVYIFINIISRIKAGSLNVARKGKCTIIYIISPNSAGIQNLTAKFYYEMYK